MTRTAFSLTLWISALLMIAVPVSADELPVGSKKFTESVILGEVLRLSMTEQGLEASHREELGGTRVLYEALRGGELVAYPEYTGTLLRELLASEQLGSIEELRAALAERGLRMSGPLGFNNTYGIGVPRAIAEERGLGTMSDLRAHPDLVFGVGNEFLGRADGWPSLASAYRLAPITVTGLDHDLAYKAIASGQIDAMDVYTTDAEIAALDLVVLDDDLGFFPRYDAVILYRADLETRSPAAVAAILRLAGTIDETTMQALNGDVKLRGLSETEVALGFLQRELGLVLEGEAETRLAGRVLGRTIEHVQMVLVAVGAAVLVGVPLGVIAYRVPGTGWAVLGVVGVMQTIPALALLALLIPLLGIGAAPAVVALFLYALLPIVRNTQSGLAALPTSIHESCTVLNLRGSTILLKVELPLASPAIVAGVKTAAVISIGFATLGALIGAGGYGQPILKGIRLDDTALILEGAVPAAGLALLTQAVLGVLERAVVPRGVRAQSRP
ncbi:MAG: glycine betaine ABC transporter substrate-binding protein [Planctomycetota bacterium]